MTPLTVAAVSAAGSRFTVFSIFYHTADDEGNDCAQNDQYQYCSHHIYPPFTNHLILLSYFCFTFATLISAFKIPLSFPGRTSR